MRRIVILMVVILTVLISVSAASAASDPRVPALKRQIAALTTHVAQLTAIVDNNADVLNRAIDTETCDWAYQGYFNIAVINVFNALLGEAPYSGAYPNDQGACSRIGRTPPHQYRTSKTTPFDTLQFQLSVLVGQR